MLELAHLHPHAMRRHLSPLLALAAIASTLTLGACASHADDAASSADEGVSADEIRAGRCVAARRYDVFLTEGVCQDVVGADGTWIAESLFPDAPADVRDTSCAYKWVGARKIDHLALYDHAHASVIAPVCAAARDTVSTTVATDDAAYWDIFIMGGATGCDVCGKLRKDKAWIILPPDRDLIGKVQVPYVNDSSPGAPGIALQLRDIPPGVRAVSIDLPPAPRGKTYATGALTVY
jgi:hypothetical protein